MQTNTEYDIYFDEQLGAVVMDWDGYATSTAFRQGTELMLNTLIKHQTSKVLADIREMVLIGLEDQRWLETEFLPRALNFGFRMLAIVNPTAYFNKVAVETISEKVDKDRLSIRFFEDLQTAKAWLNEH
ncbi:MAG: STAS/SEC14 domain-containing protein [Chitinophagaceae bacterium]|nr:STAS/SEC14 domain-containing protein [Chitinophagaceae bacterium]